MAAMILPTNDSFVALDSVALPLWGSRTYYAKSYDAGSENNDELCASIPGPQCGGDGEFTAVDGEGFVYISNGMHGIGDLEPSVSESCAQFKLHGPLNALASYRIKNLVQSAGNPRLHCAAWKI